MSQKKDKKNIKVNFYDQFDRPAIYDTEFDRISDMFSDLTGHKANIATKLCEELATLKVSMIVNRKGYETFGEVEEMPQGQYSIPVTSKYFANYLNSVKQYAAIYKQILDLYPKNEQKDAAKQELDGLQLFAKKYNGR